MNTDKFSRDTSSQALISTDTAGVSAYRTRRAKSQRMADIEDQLNSIQEQMAELRQLMINFTKAK